MGGVPCGFHGAFPTGWPATLPFPALLSPCEKIHGRASSRAAFFAERSIHHAIQMQLS